MSARNLVGIGMGVLVAVFIAAEVTEKSALAAATNGTIGVSMPNIKGPWFTRNSLASAMRPISSAMT